jgi:hypothetical protein
LEGFSEDEPDNKIDIIGWGLVAQAFFFLHKKRTAACYYSSTKFYANRKMPVPDRKVSTERPDQELKDV